MPKATPASLAACRAAEPQVAAFGASEAPPQLQTALQLRHQSFALRRRLRLRLGLCQLRLGRCLDAAFGEPFLLAAGRLKAFAFSMAALILAGADVHADANTCAHARPRAHTDTHTDQHTQKATHTHTHTRTRNHANVHTHACTHMPTVARFCLTSSKLDSVPSLLTLAQTVPRRARHCTELNPRDGFKAPTKRRPRNNITLTPWSPNVCTVVM